MNTTLFIVLWAFNSNICTMPGCCVMHYPIPAHVEVFTNIGEVQKLNLEKDTKVYIYYSTKRELVELDLKPRYKKIETDTVIGYELNIDLPDGKGGDNGK